jgi:hypothetical protein
MFDSGIILGSDSRASALWDRLEVNDYFVPLLLYFSCVSASSIFTAGLIGHHHLLVTSPTTQLQQPQTRSPTLFEKSGTLHGISFTNFHSRLTRISPLTGSPARNQLHNFTADLQLARYYQLLVLSSASLKAVQTAIVNVIGASLVLAVI